MREPLQLGGYYKLTIDRAFGPKATFYEGLPDETAGLTLLVEGTVVQCTADNYGKLIVKLLDGSDVCIVTRYRALTDTPPWLRKMSPLEILATTAE